MMKIMHNLNKSLYVFLVSALAMYSISAQESKIDVLNNPINKPNFIIIMADDLGYGDISCYGNTYINTPNIDRLSKEGIRFTDFHSNGAVCSPTRAALLTGKYQQRTGVGGVITAAGHREVGLAINEITIADELKKYGYNTGMFGKWHLGYDSKFNPSLQGFDQFMGFVSGNVDYHAHIDQEGYFDWWNNSELKDDKGYTTDLITEYGIDFIDRHNPRETGKPFFLYLPHESPHYPYQRRIDKVLRRVGEKGTDAVPADSIPGIYKEMVEVLDEGVGQIMQKLKETGLDNNTIVIFCSDNGASNNGSNGNLKGFKAGLYEGGHRVPAIAWYPTKFKGGTVSEESVLTMDFLPTFLDIIGEVPQSKTIDGISIKNHLFSAEPLPKRDLFWSFGNKNAVRSDNWKLVAITLEGQETIELFDLTEDISEKNNLTEYHPKIVKQLRKKLKNWQKEVFKGVELVSE
jgi:arylsulfatase A-like enzyme